MPDWLQSAAASMTSIMTSSSPQLLLLLLAAAVIILVVGLRRWRSRSTAASRPRPGRSTMTTNCSDHLTSSPVTSSASAAIGGGGGGWFSSGSRTQQTAAAGADWLDVVARWVTGSSVGGGIGERLVDAWMTALTEQIEREINETVSATTSTAVCAARDDNISVRFNGLRRHHQTAAMPSSPSNSADVPVDDVIEHRDVIGFPVAMHFSNTTTEVDADNRLVIRSDVATGEFQLLVSVVHKTMTGMSSINYDVEVASVDGRIQIQCTDTGRDVTARIYFPTQPEISLRCRQRASDDAETSADRLETLVRRAVARGVTTLPLRSSVTSEVNKSSNNAADASRLLVRIVRANGLREFDGGGCEPYCIIGVDDPQQTYTTSPVKNTNNPFFDEQFVFDVDGHSKQISFELRDRRQTTNGDFLGRATVSVVGHVIEGRQTLPLIGRLDDTGTTFGSLTVEIIPFNTSAVDNPLLTQRRIDTNHAIPIEVVALLDGSNEQHATVTNAHGPARDAGDREMTSQNSSSSSLPPAGLSPSRVKRRSLGSVIRSRLAKAVSRSSSSGRSLSADRAPTGRSSSPGPPVSPTASRPRQAGTGGSETLATPAPTYRSSVELQISGNPSTAVHSSTHNVAAAETPKRSAFRRIFSSKSSPKPGGGRSKSASGCPSRSESQSPPRK